jgi:hypothetical protein
MSSALNSVFGGSGIGSLVNTALSIGGMAFPPLGIANAVSTLLAGGIGQAVGGAVQTLCREAGMPKFVGDIINQVAGQVLGGMMKPVDGGCADHVGGNHGIQDCIKDFVKDLCQKIVEGTRKHMDGEEGCGGKGGKGKSGATAGSWLQAIAIAMGEIAGDKAAQMVDLSKKMSDLNANGQELTGKLEGMGKDDSKGRGDIQSQQSDNAREFSVVQAQFQATSQEFSILQNTFSNALKSIGEGLTTMGRKG